MVDDDSKNKVSEHKKPPETVEKVPAEKKHPLDKFKTGMVEHGLERRKRKSKSEIELEKVKGRLRESDVDLVQQIDVDNLESLAKFENSEQLKSLFSVTNVLLCNLFVQGLISPLAAKNLSVFANTNFENFLKGNDFIVYRKVKEIAKRTFDSESQFSVYWKRSWKKIIAHSGKSYETAKDYISGVKEEESTFKKVGNVLALGAVAGAGIYATYRLFRGVKRFFFETDDEKKQRKRKEVKKKKKGFFGKTLKWALGGALGYGGITLLGKILDKDGVTGFIKDKLGINVSWENMRKIGKAMKNLDFDKAMEILKKGVDIPEKLVPILKRAAKETGIDYDILVILGAENFEKFTTFNTDNISFNGFMNEVSVKGWEKAMDSLPKEAEWLPSGIIGFDLKQMRQLAEGRKKLMDYFKNNKVKSKIREAAKRGIKPKKVKDAFIILFGKDDLEAKFNMDYLPVESELNKMSGVIGVDERADEVLDIVKGTKLESEIERISNVFKSNKVGLIAEKEVKKLTSYAEKLTVNEDDDQKKRDLLALTTSLNSILKRRAEAYKQYKQTVEKITNKGDGNINVDDVEAIWQKALKVGRINTEVMTGYAKLQDLITTRYTSDNYHFYITVISTRLLRWWKKPKAVREYYKYLIYSKGRERVREMFRKREIKKITSKTKFSVAKETHLNRLKGDVRAKIGDVELKKVMTKSSVALDRVNMAKVADKDMVRFIELHYEKQLLKSRRTIVWHEDKIKSMAANDPDLPKMKAKLRKLKMKDLEIHSAHVQADMATHRLNIEGKVGEMAKEMSPDKILKRADFAELEKTVLRGRTFSKKLEKATSAKLKEISDAVKRGASNAEVKALDKEFRQLSEMKAKFEFNELRKVKDISDKWWKSWKEIKKKLKVSVAGSGVMGAGKKTEKMFDLAYSSQKNQLRRIIKNTAWGQAKVWMKQGVSKGFKRPLRSVGKKVMFYTLVPAALGMVGKDETRGIDWWTESKQVGMDMLPFLGTFSDAYTAITGEEYISGRKVDDAGQTIRGVMAGVGGVCDVLTFVAGAGLIGRVAVSGVRGIKGVRAAYKAYKTAMKGAEAARTVSALMKAKRIGQKAMMGLGLGSLAYYTLKPVHTVNVSPAMEEILGDELQNISQKEYDAQLRSVLQSGGSSE